LIFSTFIVTQIKCLYEKIREKEKTRFLSITLHVFSGIFLSFRKVAIKNDSVYDEVPFFSFWCHWFLMKLQLVFP